MIDDKYVGVLELNLMFYVTAVNTTEYTIFF